MFRCNGLFYFQTQFSWWLKFLSSSHYHHCRQYIAIVGIIFLVIAIIVLKYHQRRTIITIIVTSSSTSLVLILKYCYVRPYTRKTGGFIRDRIEVKNIIEITTWFRCGNEERDMFWMKGDERKCGTCNNNTETIERLLR